ncbi:MAG: NAD(P)/FAD-dependent oxidoreductase, partial [Chloroflexota bacterium]
MSKTYDCVVIGAGIGGTSSALVLAQMGLDVLVVEAGSHPRFAIGESMIATATQGYEHLARQYNLPELQQIVRYPALKAQGLVGWPKPGFWLGYHRDGVPLQRGEEMLFRSPISPLGSDVHFLRADVDSFLVSRLAAYGVAYRDQTAVVEYVPQADHVQLVVRSEGQLERVQTRFVLDCSGPPSPLAKQLQLRDKPTRLRTNSRTLFTHVERVVVLENVLRRPSARFGIKRDFNTIHHCFEGGWFWLIRFNNGVVSVGLTLDRDVYPDNDLPAEEEFRAFVRRFPTVQAQLGLARPIRPWVKTGRIQFSSHTIAGDRFLVAPHAAAFIDPLYGTGLDLTAAFILRAAPILRRVLATGDFRADHWQPLQQCFADEIDLIDKVVHGTYRSFRHFDVFKQFWRTWIYMSALQFQTYEACDPGRDSPPLAHFGASLPGWR